MSGIVGQPVSRVDGRAKVTGAARYAGEFDPPGLAYASLVLSTVPRGTIVALDTAAAAREPGVIAVMCHLDAPRLPYLEMDERSGVDPPAGKQFRLFSGPEILFSGQPVALVVAETREQADHAASLVAVDVATARAETEFARELARRPSRTTEEAEGPADTQRGDADHEMAHAKVTVDATYVQPREQHNAIELHATIAAWDGDRLTLFDKTQGVCNDRREIAHVFGIPEANVRVISPYVGGAFGAALRTWPHVAAAALAARQVGRPVLIELSRRALYTSVGFRPHTEQRVALGAARSGKLHAVIHEAVAQTSMYEEYVEETVNPSRMAYSCANVRTAYRLVEMSTNTPTWMRSPGQVTGLLALEMAMDELAAELEMDPLELRLRNYAAHDEARNLPWSSNRLRDCYRLAAERFGWDARPKPPRSMRDGAALIGHGMAMATYPAYRSAASASATVFANGSALVRSASSDMGPGTYTAIAQVAADALDLPVERVRFELGDSDLPKAPVHGGSMTMASVGSAVEAACKAVRAKIEALPTAENGTPRGADYAETMRRQGLDRIEASAEAKPSGHGKFSAYAFGAVFAEVRVDASLGTIRVPRIVGAYDVGRVVNPKIARSQCLGGMVGGIGMALLERAEWDARFGRVMNANMAEYLIPVNADVGELEVLFVPGDDRNFNPLGVKGVAEVALCGVAPAIANAVYHATGKRIRELPITLDKVLDGAG